MRDRLCSSSERARDPRVVFIAQGQVHSPGRPGIPFPHTRMNPASIDVTPPAGSALQRLTAISDTGSQPQDVHHTCPFSPGGARRDYQFAVPNARHSIACQQQKHLPHSSISAQSLPPSHRAATSLGRPQYPRARLVLTCLRLFIGSTSGRSISPSTPSGNVRSHGLDSVPEITSLMEHSRRELAVSRNQLAPAAAMLPARQSARRETR